MTPYALSFDWRGRRRSFALRLPRTVAYFAGRHLWRLGRRRWQLEEGTFASSHIPTRHVPTTRAADRVFQDGSGWHFATEPRSVEINGTRGLLIEGERTNLALWSEGKPQARQHHLPPDPTP